VVGSNCQRPNNIDLDPTDFIFRLSCSGPQSSATIYASSYSFGGLQILPYLGRNGSHEVSAFRHRALVGIASLALLPRIKMLYSIMRPFLVLKGSNHDLSGRGLDPFDAVRRGSLCSTGTYTPSHWLPVVGDLMVRPLRRGLQDKK